MQMHNPKTNDICRHQRVTRVISIGSVQVTRLAQLAAFDTVKAAFAGLFAKEAAAHGGKTRSLAWFNRR